MAYMLRYGLINEKEPREIVLLRGRGCFYKKCAFCDYHLDASPDDEANKALVVGDDAICDIPADHVRRGGGTSIDEDANLVTDIIILRDEPRARPIGVSITFQLK